MDRQEKALRIARSTYEDAQAYMRRARLKHDTALNALQEATEGLIGAGTILAKAEYRLHTLETYVRGQHEKETPDEQ
jgi:hypothetical protein